MLSAASLAGKAAPDRNFHVDPLIPGKTVTLLAGDGGTGKSLLALQLAIATAGGTNWCGFSVAQGPALYVSAEDDQDELHRRLEAICAAADVDLAKLDKLHLVCLAGEDAVLASPDKIGLKSTTLFAAIEAQVARHLPRVVILDTLADVFGGQENERSQARQFIGLLRGWAIRFEAAVLVLSHPSLTGLSSGSGTSGSTAWNNSVRSRLYLDRVKVDGDLEPDPDARVLRTVKANYGRIGGEIRLKWQDGAFRVVENAAAASAFGAIAESARADQVFLNLLDRFQAEGRHVSAFGTANNFAPTAFARHHDAAGINRRGFHAAMDRLFAAGRIKVGKSDGPPSKRREIIIRVEA